MATEPKRRVKSIRNPGDKPLRRKKKPIEKCYSRASISKLLMQVLKKRANINDSVRLIYKTHRKLIRMACEMMTRDDRKITMKMARMAMAKLIPYDVAMSTIRKFRLESSRRAEAPKDAAQSNL